MNSNNPTFVGNLSQGFYASHIDSLRDSVNSKGDQLIVNDTISTVQTSIQLNSLYPPRTDPASTVGVAIGQRVICPTLGLVYMKVTSSVWASSPITII